MWHWLRGQLSYKSSNVILNQAHWIPYSMSGAGGGGIGGEAGLLKCVGEWKHHTWEWMGPEHLPSGTKVGMNQGQAKDSIHRDLAEPWLRHLLLRGLRGIWFLLLPHPLQHTEAAVRHCLALAITLPHCSKLPPGFCLHSAAEREGKPPVSIGLHYWPINVRRHHDQINLWKKALSWMLS